MLISEAKGDYLSYMKYRKAASVTTVATYDYILHDFISVLGNISTQEMTTDLVDQYAFAMNVRNYKPKTYRNKLVIVKCFVRYLYKHSLCTLNPDLIEIPKEQYVEANFLTDIEVTKFLKNVTDPRDKALLLTLLTSGLRVSELTNLRVGDVYKRSVAVRNGKGGKPRVTFITPEAEKAIKAYLRLCNRKDGYLFANPLGNRLSRVVVARKVCYYAAKANLGKKVTTHTLRHTMATTMLKRGARVEDVQQILGHANIKTTLIYLHFTNYDLEKRYNKVMY